MKYRPRTRSHAGHYGADTCPSRLCRPARYPPVLPANLGFDPIHRYYPCTHSYSVSTSYIQVWYLQCCVCAIHTKLYVVRMAWHLVHRTGIDPICIVGIQFVCIPLKFNGGLWHFLHEPQCRATRSAYCSV